MYQHEAILRDVVKPADMQVALGIIQHIHECMKHVGTTGNPHGDVTTYVQGHLVWLKWIEALTGFVNSIDYYLSSYFGITHFMY